MDIAHAVHELRTPLASAKGFIDTVLLQWDRLDDQKRKELLTRASENAATLSSMIDQLLTLSRTRESPLHPEEIELASFLDHLVQQIAPLLDAHKVTLDIDEVIVVADKWALQTIVTNLLLNAVKYSPSGTAIRVSDESFAGSVQISVSDEGPGVVTEDQQRIFEPFARSSDDTKGTGLGLAIVKELVTRHGGEVDVVSEPGAGATFRFTLTDSSRQ